MFCFFFVSNQYLRKRQWTFLRKFLPQNNSSIDEQLPATADSPAEETEAGRGRAKGQRQELLSMANTTLANPSPCHGHCLARPRPWGPCGGQDMVTSTGCSTNPHIDHFDVNRCPPRCYQFWANLWFWPPRYTGGERSCCTLLGTARGWVSQRCNTFISH